MRHRDLFPFTDKDMSILALTARATRLVLSCRATTLQPLSVSTRLFRHHINLLCFRPMARPKRQEDPLLPVDRKSVVSGKSVSVLVDLGGRRFLKKKKRNN